MDSCDFASRNKKIVSPIAPFIRERVLKALESSGTGPAMRMRCLGPTLGPYHLELFSDSDEDKDFCCELKFRIRWKDVHANRETSIALDGIEVAPQFRRQGICTAVFRTLTHDLRDSCCGIRAVVLNAVSDEMEACLSKLGVAYDAGVSCVWDTTFSPPP